MNIFYYNLNLLTNNIIKLSNIQFKYYNYNKINNYNKFLKKKNSKTINELNKLKRKILDCEIHDLDPKRTKIDNINKYKLVFYKPTNISWDNNQINNILASIKSIEDIIQLKQHWESLKHNFILQRLYYLIDPLIKLNNMVGLSKIKIDIFKKIIYFIQNSCENEYLHTIITGPPGVGKTEFAKIYAEIFVRLGILKSDKFIEIKRDDLIGEYLGQTAIKTRKLLDSALGGVLFLDEAYSMGNFEKRDSFSKESIDMINQYLSEKKGEFMFIIAGYEQEINDCLLGYNKGMHRRFHSIYNIDGYKPIELLEIFLIKIKKSFYDLSIPRQILENFFIKHKFIYYGGDIDKLFNEIKHIQALRTFNNNINNKNIIFEDITLAYDNLFSNTKKNELHNLMYI